MPCIGTKMCYMCVPCDVMWCHVMSCHVMSRHASLCGINWCSLCDVMLCHQGSCTQLCCSGSLWAHHTKLDVFCSSKRSFGFTSASSIGYSLFFMVFELFTTLQYPLAPDLPAMLLFFLQLCSRLLFCTVWCHYLWLLKPCNVAFLIQWSSFCEGPSCLLCCTSCCQVCRYAFETEEYSIIVSSCDAISCLLHLKCCKTMQKGEQCRSAYTCCMQGLTCLVLRKSTRNTGTCPSNQNPMSKRSTLHTIPYFCC